MYNAYLRKNNVLKNENCFVAAPSTPQPQQGLNASMIKAQVRKGVGYGSTFSNFIGKKQEQE